MGKIKHDNRTATAFSHEMPRALVFASAFIFLSSTAGLAADYTPPVMDQATTFSWAGAYLGAVGGYGWGKDSAIEYVGTTYFATHPYNPSGFSYGAKAGYNFDFNPYVAGIEGDFEWSRMEGGFNDPANLAVGNPGGISRDTVAWQGSIRARMGMAVDRFLVFGTGGYAFAQMQNAYTNPTNGVTETFDKFRNGWTIGGGVDYAITDNIILGAEYRHTDFSSITNVSVTAYPGANISAKQAPTSDAIRLSLSFKF